MPTAARSMSRSKGPDGRAGADAVNSLGTKLQMWDPQVAAVHAALPAGALRPARPRQVRRAEGPLHHGACSAATRSPCSTRSGIKKINWCGLSMGGMVGQWLGANAPERIERLVLSNTSSYFPDKAAWNDRIKLVREKGVAGVRRAQHGALVHQGIPRARAGPGRADAARCSSRRRSKAIIGCCEAVRDMDQRDTPAEDQGADAGDRRPAGPGDAAARRTSTSRTTSRAPSSRTLDAAHISNVEQPEAYANRAGISAGRETVAGCGADDGRGRKTRARAIRPLPHCHGERNDGRQGALPKRRGCAPQGAGRRLGRSRRRRQDRRSTPNGRI